MLSINDTFPWLLCAKTQIPSTWVSGHDAQNRLPVSSVIDLFRTLSTWRVCITSTRSFAPKKLSLQQRGKDRLPTMHFQGPYVSFTEAKSILAIRFCTSFHLLMLRNPKKLWDSGFPCSMDEWMDPLKSLPSHPGLANEEDQNHLAPTLVAAN